MGLKRQLARRLPLLAGAAASLDRLERENAELRQALNELHALHVREAPVSADIAADGLPLPPEPLRRWVVGGSDAEWFLSRGRCAAETIVDVLAAHGIAFGALGHVLDFGCGCGRVVRHLAVYTSVRLHGTDYNRTAIAWCDEHLRCAEFSTNDLAPPTRYRAQSFDLIWAFSVFTHLIEPLQHDWMAELRRILKPRAYLIISTHGAAYLPQLAAVERARFERGELVVVRAELAGRNDCGAYHPEAYVRTELARGYEVVDFRPRGWPGNAEQDLYLLRRSD
jgi:SAM-dependent methyltransferase